MQSRSGDYMGPLKPSGKISAFATLSFSHVSVIHSISQSVRLTRVWRSANLFTLLFTTVLTLLASINIKSRDFLEFF